MTALGALASARRARARARDAVRAEADLLAPGRYVMAGETLWRHRDAPVPEHLRRTKGGGRTPQRPTPGAAGPALRAVARRWALPGGFRVPGPGRADGGYTLAVAAYDGGVVLLDPAGGRVARTRPAGDVPTGYADLRRRFEAHLGSPRFTVADGGRLVVERFVVGRHLAEASPGEQLDALRHLVRGCTALVQAEAEGLCDDLVDAALAAVAAGPAPAGLTALLARVPVARLSRGWPLVPTATDATVRNLVLLDDGRPVPIDLGEVRLAAFLLYPVGMIANARPHGLRAFLAGALDAEVGDLLAAAGGGWPLTPDGRGALVALRTALTALEEATGDGGLDAGAFARALARRWANVALDRHAPA